MSQTQPTGLKIGQEENDKGNLSGSIDKVHIEASAFINSHYQQFHFTQRNGQRIFGPSRFYTGAEPNMNCEVFIGKLPRFVFEDVLVPLLLEVGEFYNLRILLDFDGGNRGFAFARFYDRATAKKACAFLNHFQILPNRYLGCTLARNNNEIILGNIPQSIRPNVMLGDVMQLQDIIKCIKFIPSDCQGYYHVVVEFITHRDAALSRRVLIAHRYESWRGKTFVDWASKHQKRINQHPHCWVDVYETHFILNYGGVACFVYKKWYKENYNKLQLLKICFR